MTKAASPNWIEQLGLTKKQAPNLFRSLDEIESPQNNVAQVHVMRRAWKDLELNGILYQDMSPYVYFKEVSYIEPSQVRELHRQLWNQGIAPFLILISPDQFYVYSSLAFPAKPDEDINDGNRLVEVLSRTANALELRQFIRSIEFGELFRNKPQSFDPNLRVDRYLLKNLEAARELLRQKVNKVSLDLKIIHALLWRTIFISYLTDRKIIDTTYFARIGAVGVNGLLSLLETFDENFSKELLYRLFQQLKQDFNGDLFEGDLITESQSVQGFHIQTLKELLRGDDLSSGQISLGFWVYDFSVIPIETISGIYERFLEAENSQQKRESGTYYTPRFLAEIVLDIALENFTSLSDKRFLDPSCGSGIFLVSLFNRLAEEWLRNHKSASNEERATALSHILLNQLFGVDADPTETACRIAAFSLYLAFLDQLEPRDIQRLQEQGSVLPNLVGHNLLCQDFFDDALAIPKDFDFVVGNPPWARGSKDSETSVERWCKQEGLPIAQKQLAYGFIWKASYHIKNDSHICFILPSAILLNHQTKALEAQLEWLSKYTIEQVLNLSDMRLYLFEGAVRPALVVKFRPGKPDKKNHYINYLVPKTEPETLRAEIIGISPEDRVRIKLSELLHDLGAGKAALAWKQNFWGTPRDQKFLDRLNALPCLGDAVDQLTIKSHQRTKRWIIGQGFQPEIASDDPEKIKIPSWTSEQLFLEGKSKAIDLLLIESDCDKVGDRFRRLRRLPDEKIFQSPHVLVSQGLKVAYTDFDVVFRHAIQGIHGPKKDANLLAFLAVTLNSHLATYFLFHTSANWGTERDKTHEHELLRFPFPFPEDTQSPDKSKEIIREVGILINQVKKQISQSILGRTDVIDAAKRDLLVYVYRYYNIDEQEQILINDTVNCWIPSSTPNRGSIHIPTLKGSTKTDRSEYLTILCNLLNTWSRKGRYQVSGKILVSSKSGIGVIVLQKISSQASSHILEEESSAHLDKVLNRIEQLLPTNVGSISFYRNLKVFDQENLYILKPLTYRFWSKTMALNDADEIAAAILTSNHKDN
jgi:N-6 DNA Methylase